MTTYFGNQRINLNMAGSKRPVRDPMGFGLHRYTRQELERDLESSSIDPQTAANIRMELEYRQSKNR